MEFLMNIVVSDAKTHTSMITHTSITHTYYNTHVPQVALPKFSLNGRGPFTIFPPNSLTSAAGFNAVST